MASLIESLEKSKIDTESSGESNDVVGVKTSRNNTKNEEASNKNTAIAEASKEPSTNTIANTQNTEASSNNNYVYPITTMFGGSSPWTAPEFPLIVPSNTHAVLYIIPTNGFQNKPPQPYPGQDMWDGNHVRMPCSKKSLYEVEDVTGTIQKSRWKIIENALTRKPIRNSRDMANAILRYNTKFKRTWTFHSLHDFFEKYLEISDSKDFFKNTMPGIVKLVLDLPKLVQAPIPLLKKDMNMSISISQLQIASLLANAFFCTFPRRNATGPGTEYSNYPRINFINLYESDAEGIMEKLNCICNYFERVCSKNSMPTGVVTFSRRSVPTHACPDWEQSDVTTDSIPMYVDERTNIEDADGMIQVNFSNKYLGGAVLENGLVQHEIRFLICPELMASMLFTEVLGPNEALMVIGCERFSNYTGYGSDSFIWVGDFCDNTPYDASRRRRCAVLSIDALVYKDDSAQYRKDKIIRELNKAWTGFSFYTDKKSQGLNYPGVATGNWGCGAFGGSPQLKSVIQLMASAVARRPIAYFTFGDARLKDDVIKTYNMLRRYKVNIGELFHLLMTYCNTDGSLNLRVFLKQELRKKNRHVTDVNCMKNVC